LAKYYPISIIFGSSIPEEISTKMCMLVTTPVYCGDTVPC